MHDEVVRSSAASVCPGVSLPSLACQGNGRRATGVELSSPTRGEPLTDASRIEFDRQTDRLVELGMPALAGISEEDLRALVAPLADFLPAPRAPREGHAPFVIVLTRELVEIGRASRRERVCPYV